jgi:putative ABC transport system permease protein
MRETPIWRRYLRLRGSDPAADVEDELAFHLAMRVEDLMKQGVSEVEARARARREFGDVEAIRREMREIGRARQQRARRARGWESLAQDVRIAARGLRRSPGFTLVAVLTLALGIGANAALFSILDAVLLRPLPYASEERVIRVFNHWEGTARADLSPAEYLDLREQVGSLQALGVYADGWANLTGGDRPERVRAAYLSASLFPVLGVGAVAGRTFTEAEDAPGAAPVVVLGHALWSRRFAADPGVLGREIRVDGEPAIVVGVMPPGFALPGELAHGESSDVYLPLRIDRVGIPNRGSHFLQGVARLRPGVTLAGARRELAAVAAGFVRDFPGDYPASMGFGTDAVPVRDAVLGQVRPVLLLLMGAVGVVLLIACVNLASLLLARADARRRELAVRRALGAGRGRLVRLLLTESLLLSLAGGAVGLAIGGGLLGLLPLVHAPDLPRLDQVGIDGGALAFTVGVAILTTLLFGLAPALSAASREAEPVLRESGRGATIGRARRRVRAALVSGQVALAAVLLISAGLLLRSLISLQHVDPGYRTDGVLTAQLSLPASDYPDDREVVEFYRTLLQRLRALPGVVSAGAVTSLPLATSLGDLNFRVEGREIPQGDVSPRADWQAVTPGYFETLGMRLVRGRGLEPHDDARAPGVAVINEAVARRYWPGRDPLGQRLLLGGGAGPGWVTVVGIVADVRHGSLRDEPEPQMYIPHAQFRFWNAGGAARSLSLVLRTLGDPMAQSGALRQRVSELDPNLTVSEVRTLSSVRSESVARPRFVTLLLGLFATLAALLAAVGIYGLVAYQVTLRIPEIGIRMALGARASSIVRLVLRQGLVLAVAGLLVGVLGALAATRLLAHLLFGVAALDPVTFLSIPLLLVAVALLASWLPARRAARLDPVTVLRAE